MRMRLVCRAGLPLAGVLAFLSLGCGGSDDGVSPDASGDAQGSTTDGAGPDLDGGAIDDAGATSPDASPTPDAPPLPARCLDEPGACSWAFSLGRFTENDVIDEFVEIGFYRYVPGETAEACSHTGPKALKLYWHWGPGNRPSGTCTSDRVSPSRWDHATPDLVDACPSAASWAPTSAVLKSCAPHMTAGFGRSSAMITLTGNVELDPASRAVTFRFLDVNGKCRKEYWNVQRVVMNGAATELVSFELDGARTGDTSTSWKGTGNTHGYGYGSSASTTAYVAQDVVAQKYASSVPFATADASLYTNAIAYTTGLQGSWQHCGPYPNVLFQYSCHSGDAGTTPDLVACNTPNPDGSDSAGAYLKYIADAFSSNNRYNVWYSFHALLTQGTGCYHWGLHSQPMIQVMGSSGEFRGWVGVEYQESGDQGMAKNLYHVLRRVEQGYE